MTDVMTQIAHHFLPLLCAPRGGHDGSVAAAVSELEANPFAYPSARCRRSLGLTAPPQRTSSRRTVRTSADSAADDDDPPDDNHRHLRRGLFRFLSMFLSYCQRFVPNVSCNTASASVTSCATATTLPSHDLLHPLLALFSRSSLLTSIVSEVARPAHPGVLLPALECLHAFCRLSLWLPALAADLSRHRTAVVGALVKLLSQPRLPYSFRGKGAVRTSMMCLETLLTPPSAHSHVHNSAPPAPPLEEATDLQIPAPPLPFFAPSFSSGLSSDRARIRHSTSRNALHHLSAASSPWFPQGSLKWLTALTNDRDNSVRACALRLCSRLLCQSPQHARWMLLLRPSLLQVAFSLLIPPPSGSVVVRDREALREHDESGGCLLPLSTHHSSSSSRHCFALRESALCVLNAFWGAVSADAEMLCFLPAVLSPPSASPAEQYRDAGGDKGEAKAKEKEENVPLPPANEEEAGTESKQDQAPQQAHAQAQAQAQASDSETCEEPLELPGWKYVLAAATHTLPVAQLIAVVERMLLLPPAVLDQPVVSPAFFFQLVTLLKQLLLLEANDARHDDGGGAVRAENDDDLSSVRADLATRARRALRQPHVLDVLISLLDISAMRHEFESNQLRVFHRLLASTTTATQSGLSASVASVSASASGEPAEVQPQKDDEVVWARWSPWLGWSDWGGARVLNVSSSPGLDSWNTSVSGHPPPATWRSRSSRALHSGSQWSWEWSGVQQPRALATVGVVLDVLHLLTEAQPDLLRELYAHPLFVPSLARVLDCVGSRLPLLGADAAVEMAELATATAVLQPLFCFFNTMLLQHCPAPFW